MNKTTAQSTSFQIPVISLFTGGGFMDLGFAQAGFRTAFTNEINAKFAELFVAASRGVNVNGSPWLPPAPAVTCISELKAADVLRSAFGRDQPEIFGVIGGPPCPDFSRGGLNNGGTGSNGKLTHSFVEMVCRLSPTFFVMENVPGLFHTKKHRAYLDSQLKHLCEHGNYLIDLKLLNSLDFGAPQDRERLFVIGFRKRFAYGALGVKSAKNLTTPWFPWPIGPYAYARKLEWPQVYPFGRKPRKPDGLPTELMVYSVLGPENDPEKVANGKDVFVAYSSKFRERAEGDVKHKSFKRLHRYRFSPTVWFGNREVHLHPWKRRRLSVREALRLQTVPDDYVLPAAATLSTKFKIIGNGVPCVVAKAIGDAVLGFIGRSKSR